MDLGNLIEDLEQHLHQKYLSDIKQHSGYIDKNYVIEYFNGLHPSQQMHILNCRKTFF